MERKEFLKGALSSLALLSVPGCLTAKLYEPRKYDETALSFFVTEDGSRVVVLGEQYHYIFDDISPSLKQILLSPLNLRTVVFAHLANFDVSSNNVVTGDYSLSLSDQASDEQRKSAIDAGFVTPDLILSGHLKGVRYSAEGFPSTAQTQEFARPHFVTVREQKPMAAKIWLTPVTVAADGALILGGLFLLVLVLAAMGPHTRAPEEPPRSAGARASRREAYIAQVGMGRKKNPSARGIAALGKPVKELLG